MFDPTSAVYIQKLSKLLSKDKIKNDLIYISVNFYFFLRIQQNN